MARIMPLYKGGDKENFVNYRSIYVLPCFSKLLERIMYIRTLSQNLKIEIEK